MKLEKLLNFVEKELEYRLSNETVKSYLYIIKRFLEQYPKAHKLTLTDIESYFASLKQNGKSAEYRKVILSSLKALFECYLELGMIKEHPFRTYHIDEKKPKGKDFSSFLTIEEMEQLLSLKEERYQYVENRNKAIIGLLIYQGVTSKELINLKLQDVDLDNGTIRIVGKGKNATRTLALKPSQVKVLLNYIYNDREQLLKINSEILIISMRGTAMTVDSIHALINRLSLAFDKEVSPLNIRNSVIHYWLNVRKFPLEHVQVMAGHCYPSTTEQYRQPDINEQREAVSKLHSSIFG